MDKVQSEITDKIRNAIKKKLIEINLFVDNELPDYIMILIANKRSKHHMEKDLSLFLGNQTTNFTNWLWDLVSTLKAGAKSKHSASYSYVELKHGDNFIETKENRADEDDVLNYDPAEEGETLCVEDLNELVNNHSVKLGNELFDKSEPIKSVNFSATPNPIEKSANFNLSMMTSTPDSVLHTGEAKNPQIVSSPAVSMIHPLPSIKTSQKSAKVYPMLRTKPSNDVDIQNVANSYDPTMPDYSRGVSSVVCVSHRKYGGPAALQANKLLLRAVNDAAKSVLDGKDINEYYKPTPIKELSSHRLNDRIIKKNWEENIDNLKELDSLTTFDVNKASDQEVSLSASQSKRIVNLPQFSSKRGCKDSDISLQKFEHSIDQLESDENPIAPHFIVTLDGVSFSSLKRKHSVEEPMEVDEEEEDLDDYFEDTTSPKKQKLNERCKYWPACKNSDSCLYHHPTITCKSFPNCKFGEKCLYIHPNCKFDSLCSKKNCPYTHCSKRNTQAIPPPVAKPIPVQSAKTVCKFYPKCTAKSCRFIHPKLCKFGIQCRAPTCPFSHFKVPQRNQLKWKATA